MDDAGALWECGIARHGQNTVLPPDTPELWHPRRSQRRFQGAILYAAVDEKHAGVVTDEGVYVWTRNGWNGRVADPAAFCQTGPPPAPILRTPCRLPGLCVGSYFARRQECALALAMGAHGRLGADSAVGHNVAEVVFATAWRKCK